MRILCLLLALIVLAYAQEGARLGKLVKNVRKLRGRKGKGWKPKKVIADKKYDYNSAKMSPLRFRTVDDDSSRTETWLTFNYQSGWWGQLRFSSNGWGVELYACTDDKLYDGKNVMTGVPNTVKKMWSVHWDADRFYLDCNGKNVWTFEFKDSIFPDSDCRGMYTETQRGALTQFTFNGRSGSTNVPDKFFVKKK